MKKKKKKNKKKVKIRYTRILLCLLLLYIFVFFLYQVYKLPITNIYIKGNSMITDQEIIDLLGIGNYPAAFSLSSSKLKKKLNNHTYIKEASIHKKNFREIYIEVVENKPLFYYQPEEKTVLLDGSQVSATFDIPIVVNYIPDTKYQKFQEIMATISDDVRSRISEIKYDPNEVDEGRFLLTMNDQNYVYVTLSKFEIINKYIDIISKEEFASKKGILKLDAGNSFEILE